MISNNLNADSTVEELSRALSAATYDLTRVMRLIAYARKEELDFTCNVINDTRAIDRKCRNLITQFRTMYE